MTFAVGFLILLCTEYSFPKTQAEDVYLFVLLSILMKKYQNTQKPNTSMIRVCTGKLNLGCV